MLLKLITLTITLLLAFVTPAQSSTNWDNYKKALAEQNHKYEEIEILAKEKYTLSQTKADKIKDPVKRSKERLNNLKNYQEFMKSLRLEKSENRKKLRTHFFPPA